METKEGRGKSGRRAPPVRKGLPTQFIILALVAVLVIPGIAFAGFLLIEYAQAQRERSRIEGLDVARAASSVLDRHLNGLRTTLQTLAASETLAAGDLEGFYRQAERVKAFVGADIGLRRLDGQQLVNTRLPFGAPLPLTPFAIDEKVKETRGPLVSGVLTGAVSRHPIVAIVLPVIIDGQVKYLLHISTDTERFLDEVRSVAPGNWLVGVGDRNGVYVTRTENHSEFTGKPGAPDFLAAATSPEGTFIGKNAFGEDVLVGYSHTALGNWLVAANIELSLLQGPLDKALLFLTAFGATTLIISSLIALWLWRFVARPLEGLEIASQRIGVDPAPARIKTSLREFIALGNALESAAERVRSHNDMLDAQVAERTQDLARANNELTAQMAAREKAEAQLRQVQKMEAVGQLTGGIAHDFNNMLGIVMSSLSLVQRRLERGDNDVHRFVESAMEGVRRAAALTSRLLAFSRQQPLSPAIMDANRLVAGMSELLQRTLGAGMRIETVLAAGLWKTHVDASQLENAILNLAVNARDAMEEGGRLTIETANAALSEDYADTQDGLSAGQYVLIAITDTGAGMSEEVMRRAFDPFFTTKKTGMGTGLGLSQVYGFVKQSQGHVSIYSELGQGTTIKLYLPRHYGEEPVAALRLEAAPLPGGTRHDVILVVEDEDKLRQVTAAALRDLGYGVFEAPGGKEALALLEQHPEVRLLLTDIVMPGMNGRKLADAAKALRPDLLVLFTTGFTRNAVVHNGVLDAGVNFIPKPFGMDELAAKIQQVISSA